MNLFVCELEKYQQQRHSGGARFLFISLVLLFACSIITPVYADPLPAPSYAGGDGSLGSPFLISNLSELHRLTDTPLDWSKFFELSDNIDATDTATWNSGAGWQPIGSAGDGGCECFSGSFDGKGHTITGLVIDRPLENNIGLFQRTIGATIHNLHLDGGNMKGNLGVGSLVSDNRGTISSCSASSEVTATLSNVGGLVGYNDSIGVITSSYATGNVLIGSAEKFNNAGGLVGHNAGSVRLSFATGNVVGSNILGGLVGYNSAGKVQMSYATGNVDGESLLGGLVGSCYNGAEVSLSFASGNVTNLSGLGGGNADRLGGLVGSADTLCAVSKSYAWGDVAGNAAQSWYVGGLVGYMNNASSVVSSYATGNVTGSVSVGGLVGSKGFNGSVSLSYWDTETSGTDTGVGDVEGGATGLTSAQMKQQASFPDFDFLTDWFVLQGAQPPLLQWHDFVFNSGFEGG